MKTSLLLLVLLVACGDSSGPAGIDPVVDITNQTQWPVYFQWRDGQGVVGADVIPAMTRRCERFFARADSAYWQITASDLTIPSDPKTSIYTAPWFDPDARHAWSVLVTPGAGSPVILMRQDSTVIAC